MKFFDNTRQYMSIKCEIDNAIQGVIDNGNFILGKEVNEFEEKIAEYYGMKYAVGVGSGSDALRIASMALNEIYGSRSYDIIYVPDFTYIASADFINREHDLRLRFLDVDESGRIFAMNVVKKYNDLLIPVHLFGLMTREINCGFVIEDGAQSIGAERNGKKYHEHSDFVITSFFPTKNLGCFGDGGMILTNDKEHYEFAKSIRVHGSGKNKYLHTIHGVNSRLDTIQAAILNVKLKYLDDWIERRRYLAKRYNEHLGEYVGLPEEPEGFKHVYNQYTITTQNRDELKGYLETESIPTMIYYPIPLHRQPMYGWVGGEDRQFPTAVVLSEQVLSLPIYPELLVSEQDDVIKNIVTFFEKKNR
jgi:dTDP-4-amino-4,6-dideoxygalactose transaminase